ncbi:MAG: DEAD/DEAH box helicase [Schleiferiaceae bacterium]|jgi:superfamily II DNA/RNA helicase|nr:DEAD/DEAH box helicase [Schleiferiaceae bacterium]MDP4626957.1 DEAD/DEAH box helicase [Schleiferiaceae bacterium]MDP4900982.1 DEAD/DEAH box helicase [Schleiferiaceae bacterium]
MRFDDFDLNDTLLDAVYYMNYTEATEIQAKAIPLILEGNDLIGCAQTGTGKTAAFLLPLLNHLSEIDGAGVKALILCPTRELAIQIAQQAEGLSYFTHASVKAVYGGGDGVAWDQEKAALTGKADLIIATPGRLMAHMEQGYVKFDRVEFLVLDEADRMLDIGFYDDILKIIDKLPKKRQSLMFSATMASRIRQLAVQILQDPQEVSVAIAKPAEGVTQKVYLAFDEQKVALARHLLADKDEYKQIIVFCSTKKKVEQLYRKLRDRNFACAPISSDYTQEEREQALSDFKNGRTRILVATDVMSRGIDVKGIDLVMNFDVPHDAEDYVHRIGRTARAKTTGMAITLVSPEDMYRFSKIERLIERELEKLQPPTELGEGPQWEARSKGSGRPGGGRPGGNGGANKRFGKPKGPRPQGGGGATA